MSVFAKRKIAFAAIVGVTFVVCGVLRELVAQDRAVVQQESRLDDVASRNSIEHGFRAEFARMRYKHDQLNLELAKLDNEAQLVSMSVVNIARQNVEGSGAFVEIADDDDGTAFPYFVGFAQTAFEHAREEFLQAKTTYELVQTKRAELVMERSRSRLEMARSTLDYGKSLANATEEEQAQWKFYFLLNEMLTLQSEVEVLKHAPKYQ